MSEPLNRPDNHNSDVLDAIFGMLNERLIRHNGFVVRPQLEYPYIRIPVSHSPTTPFVNMRISENGLLFMNHFESILLDLSDPKLDNKIINVICNATHLNGIEITDE